MNLNLRPNGPVDPDAIAAWEARVYPRLRRYAPPAPGDIDLDDVLPGTDEALDAPDVAAATIVDELGIG